MPVYTVKKTDVFRKGKKFTFVHWVKFFLHSIFFQFSFLADSIGLVINKANKYISDIADIK